MKRLLILPLLCLPACARTRLYTEQELGTLARSCGYALGQVSQDAEEKRLLLVLTSSGQASGAEQCIYRWARPRRLHVVFAQVEQGQ